jgi:FMN phosphatase YigB (HAD superfamily)
MSSPPPTVTFDCWQTLLYEHSSHPHGFGSGRASLLASHLDLAPEQVADALAHAWREHQRAWHRRVAFAAPQMTQHALRTLGVTLDPPRFAALLDALETEILQRDIRAVDGSRALLEALREAGVRTALICDTGFSPGRVVRQVLARLGLLEFLEVQVFSDEVGVPKPDARAFRLRSRRSRRRRSEPFTSEIYVAATSPVHAQPTWAPCASAAVTMTPTPARATTPPACSTASPQAASRIVRDRKRTSSSTPTPSSGSTSACRSRDVLGSRSPRSTPARRQTRANPGTQNTVDLHYCVDAVSCVRALAKSVRSSSRTASREGHGVA